MAILKSTLVNGDLTVTGSLNVQGDLTYIGVENLRVKDKQIELNTNGEGSAIASGEAANGAGIVFKGTTKGSSPEASILYDYADDALVVNKTIKGTVASANNAASADKVANKLTVNVTDETGSVKTVEFDGSEAKTVDVNLKGLQDQISSLTGGAGSIKSQIDSAINALNSDVTASATGGDAQKGGILVLQEVTIGETAGKLDPNKSALTAVEVEQAGAAAAAKTALIGKDTDDKNSDTIKGAKKYADSLANNYAAASHKHVIDDVTGLSDALAGKAAADHTHADYDAHLADLNIHVTTTDKNTWNAKQNALTETQLAAVNSGITAGKVSGYDAHILDTTKHITDTERETWNAAEQNAKDYADGLNTTMDGRVKDLEAIDHNALAASASADAVAKVLDGAPESFDTLKEVAAWIADNSHASTVAELVTDVNNLKNIDHDAYKAADATTLASAKSYADGLAKNYAAAKHSHAITDVTGLDTALAGKAAVDHNHDTVYSKIGHTHVVADVTDLQAALDAKQDDLSADQLNAVNSGITADKVTSYGNHIKNNDIHVTTTDKANWNAAEKNAKDYADEKVAELKNTVDSLSADALKSVAAGDYVSVSTKSDNSQTISVTTKGVASASTSDNGLALAADVKKYVDDKNASQDTEISKIKDGTALDDRYVNVSGDTMTGDLTMSNSGIIFGNMKIVWNSANGGAIEFIPTTA